MAAFLAALFWLYPTDYDRPGWRGSFDLSFCRFTRIGLENADPAPVARVLEDGQLPFPGAAHLAPADKPSFRAG